MSYLVRVHNQLFRRARANFRNVLSHRQLNYYSQKPENEIKKSKKSTYLFIAFFGVVSASYAYYVKKQKDFAIMKEREKALRKIRMGGKWELTDSNGKLRSTEDFRGKWCMIYFGFTHCPDICPDEMEKLAKVVDGLEEENIELLPIFITIDPDRDTQEVVGKYVKEFSGKIIGLTGTMDEIKKVGQAYNVYFKAGPKDTSDDYIVDHTIILYLIDPTGLFVDYYGTRSAADDVIASVKFNMDQWKKLKEGEKSLVSRLLS